MMIMDKRLVRHRINEYSNAQSKAKEGESFDLQSKGLQCDLGMLNNTGSFFTVMGMDSVLYCDPKTYTYKISNLAQSSKLGQGVYRLYSHDFQVKAILNKAPITYWFEMIIGLNFMASSGLKVLVSRSDHIFDENTPYQCLFDKSCVLAQMSEKNVLRLELILTAGSYKVTFLEHVSTTEEDSVLKKSFDDLSRPISVRVQANTIIQNEERVNCPYMFMDEYFIQNKFIDDMNGQRFSFEDKLVINVFNLSQHFYIRPEVDSVIKVRAKEAFGVNMAMKLLRVDTATSEVEIAESLVVGSTEVLSYGALKKDQKYKVEMSLGNSIIQMSEFFTCPHFSLAVSMVSLSEAQVAAGKLSKLSDTDDYKSELILEDIFNAFTEISRVNDYDSDLRSYTFLNHSTIFAFNVDGQQNNQIITSKIFNVGPNAMQLFVEIFYEPTYLHDLELSLFSKDVKNVRAHINQKEKQASDLQWAMYKSTKTLFVALEPGEYEIAFVYKGAYDPLNQNANLKNLLGQRVEFQLQLIYAEKIERQQVLPTTLNYFGMMGPSGRDFGQMIYFCEECVIENTQLKIIEFTLDNATNTDINFDAIITSPDNSVDVRLELAANDTVLIEKSKSYGDAFQSDVKKGEVVGSRMTRDRGGRSQQKEESLTASNLQPKHKYRVVITVKNTEQDIDRAYKFNLRIEIQEKPKLVTPQLFGQKNSLLPQSIDEIARYKLKNQGIKESDFLIANTQTLEFIDKEKLHPFMRKSQQVYQANIKGTDIIHMIEFEIKEELSLFYAAIFDYTGFSGLGLKIIKHEDNTKSENGLGDEDFELLSIPSKYFSYISPQSLLKGKYYLAVFPQTKLIYEDADLVKFGLDVLIEKEDTANGFSNELLESAMQFCGVPSSPRALNFPQYLHPLSGNQMQAIMKLRMSDFLTGDSIAFDIKGDDETLTMVQVYIDFPKDVKLDAAIYKGYSTQKSKASYKDLNQDQDNFLKVKDLKTRNVIQLRSVVEGKGNFMVNVKGLEADSDVLGALERCDTLTIGITIYPIVSELRRASVQDICETSTALGNQIMYGEDTKGSLIYTLGGNVFDTSYITTASAVLGESPYLFYFQASYDSALEGPLALILYRYNKDVLSFDEVATYSLQDSQTHILARIEDEGTYVIAIESLSSSVDKYAIDMKVDESRLMVLPNPCIKIAYNYLITSISPYNYYKKISEQLNSQLQSILPEINECSLDNLPSSFPISEAEYDLHYNIMFKRKAEDIIDVVVEGPDRALFKVILYSYGSPKNNFDAFLYKNQSMVEVPSHSNSSMARSVVTFDEKTLLSIISPQRKPVKLKLVYDTVDEADECPVFSMRVAQKSIKQVLSENMQCTTKQLPPEQIKVDSDIYTYQQDFQISAQFLDQYGIDSIGGGVKDVNYDIEIKVPNATQEYYFDVELGFDFITSNMEAELYMKNAANNKLVFLANSQVVMRSEHRTDGDESYTTSNKAIKRIKLDNIRDLLQQGQQLSDTFILRIVFSKLMTNLIYFMRAQKVMERQDQVCFPFDISMRISKPMYDEKYYETHTDKTENEIIRIDWDYRTESTSRDQNGIEKSFFDPRMKLTGYVEFKEAIKTQLNDLKSTNSIYMVSLNETKSQQKFLPQSIRIADTDKSTLIVTFPHAYLSNGQCYRLFVENYLLSTRINTDIVLPGQVVCTTKCEECNKKGTKGCDEQLGSCLCHSPFSGKHCDQCDQGFIFDKKSGDCLPINKCKENEGTEACNGHGTCYQDEVSGQAKCRCDSGFTDDGLDLCGKCLDSMFTYPNCHQRYWMVLHNEYNCNDLDSRLPMNLFANETGRVYQNVEGQLYWNKMYRLDDSRNEDQSRLKMTEKSFTTTHYFKVPKGNGIFRMFYDTHSSGVRANVKVLDDQKKVIYSTLEESIGTDVSNGVMFLMLEESGINIFSVVIQYTYVKEKSQKVLQQCPLIEILMIVQPFSMIQDFIKCTDDQIANLGQIKRTQWNLQYDSSFFNQNITLSSNDAFNVTNQNKQSQDQSESFYIHRQAIKVEDSAKGHALSILLSYNFETVFYRMAIRDTRTKNVIAINSFSYLEDIVTESDLLYGSYKNLDMLSFIEIPSIIPGDYELEIVVDKGMYLPKQGVNTCLNFDFAIEHVAIKGNTQDSNRYDIVAVLPAQQDHLTNISTMKVEVKFNKNLVLEDLIPGGDFQSELSKLCFLESSDFNGKGTVYAKKALLNKKDSIELYFNMAGVKIDDPTRDKCYSLKCDIVRKGYSTIDESTKAFFGDMQVKTQYCIKPIQAQPQCNPNAMAKVIGGACQCTYPYQGSLCEDCARGFQQTSDQSKHSVCAVDMTQCSSEVCNNHGQCIAVQSFFSGVECKCSNKYIGQFCDKCKNNKYAYPDCDTENLNSDIYSANKKLPDYLERQKYNVNGYETSVKEGGSRDYDSCLFANYPSNLQSLEFMGFLPSSGDFHVADFYTINHDSDNVIKFVPQAIGTFKILVQEPEAESLEMNSEGFDIEIGIYDKKAKKFIASNVNHYLDIENHQKLDRNVSLFSGKLDFTVVQLTITKELVNKTLQVIFRAVNFTNEDETDEDPIQAACASVYIEMQYKSGVDATQETGCVQGNEQITPLVGNNKIIKVNSENPFQMTQDSVYLVQGSTPHFFYSQDFYIGDPTLSNEPDYEFHIAVLQKFMDHALVDFIIEVLHFDADQKQYSELVNSQPQTNPGAPICDKMCLTGGQKAYNEFHNIAELAARTVIRLWLYKHSNNHDDEYKAVGECGKFQLLIEAHRQNNKRKSIQSASEMRCVELELPNSLNTERYLGEEGQPQTSFHFLEKYRIDNLKDNAAHEMFFILDEPTMIRVVALQHKHVEFDLELLQHSSSNQAQKLIESGAKGYEDSVYAQLEKGRYSIKLLFVSDSFFLQQPCQSVEIEIAFSPLSQLKARSNSYINGLTLPQSLNFTAMLQRQFPSKSPIKVSKPAMVTSYNLLDENVLTNYKSYVELYSQKFILQQQQSQVGLLIDVQSDFLTNDVSFALTYIPTQTLIKVERTENGKRLLIKGITGGEYELMIYCHQSLYNIKTGSQVLQAIDVYYQVDMHLINWADNDADFRDHVYQVKVNGVTELIPAQTYFVEQLDCHLDYEEMPTAISSMSSLNGGKLDLNKEYMIPGFIATEKLIKYSISQGQDVLRLQVDRANTKVKIRRQGENKAFASSFSINNGESQILMASGLATGNVYEIVFEFDQDDNQEEYEIDTCQSFTLIAQSFSQSQKCTTVSRLTTTDYQTLALSLSEKKDHLLSFKDSQTVSKIIKISGDQTTDIDLSIALEFTDLYYVPTLTLSSQSLSQSDKQAFLSAIKPNDIDSSIKNLMQYQFSGLKTNVEYFLTIALQKLPKNCQNYLKMSITSKISTDLTPFEKQNPKVFISHEEIKSLNRYVEPLPISLDSFKYLRNESSYLLVSEYLAMDLDTESQNYLTFTVDQNQTVAKFLLETDEIYMSLKGQNVDKKSKSSLFSEALAPGKYTLSFEFSTEAAQRKSDLTKNTFHVTILIADSKFINDKYYKPRAAALSNCDNNKNFPLALNKVEKHRRNIEELVYDYPFIRLSGESISYKLELDRYAFRINDTSRFFLTLGMHSLVTTGQLRLAELKGNGMSYIGKQEFNLNVLDYVVSPGDYALYIEQPSPVQSNTVNKVIDYQNSALTPKPASSNICGLFSLSGRITPIDDSEAGSAKVSQIQQSRCPIKQVLPTKIYKSQIDTKDGLENYINQEGTYSRAFHQLSVKKAKDMTSIMSDSVFIEIPDDGLLSVMVQYRSKATNIIAKVKQVNPYSSSELIEIQPIHKAESESARGVLEVNFVFNLVQGKQYYLMIFYEGEVLFDKSGTKETCEYYSAYLNFDSVSRLSNELSCIDQTTAKSFFVDGVPDAVKSSEITMTTKNEYIFQSYTQINYPNDYEKHGMASAQTGFKAAGNDKDLLRKNIEILNDGNSYLDIDARVKFDFPYSQFNFNLLDKMENENGEVEYEESTVQLPIQLEKGDEYSPIMIRQLSSTMLEPKTSYQLWISDEVSWYVMRYVYEKKKQPLCLYSKFTLTVTKKDKDATLFSTIQDKPLVVAVQPLITAPKEGSQLDKYITLQKGKNTLQVSLTFNSIPFLKGTVPEGKQSEITIDTADIAKMVSLEVYNPNTKELKYAKAPIRVVPSMTKDNQLQVTFGFGLKQELVAREANGQSQLLVVKLDSNNTVDQKNRAFTMGQGLTLPRFMIEGTTEIMFESKKSDAEKVDGEIDKIKGKSIKEKNDSQRKSVVKCLCVHGTCLSGEELCNRCENGWLGRLCDTPMASKSINNKDSDSAESEINRYQAQSRMQRMRRDDNGSQDRIITQSGVKAAPIMKETEPARIPRAENLEQNPFESHPVQNGEDDGFFSTLLRLLYNAVMLTLTLAILCYGAFWLTQHRKKLREYASVSLFENGDEEEEDSIALRNHKATELVDFKATAKPNPPPAVMRQNMPMNTQSLNFPPRIASHSQHSSAGSQPQNHQPMELIQVTERNEAEDQIFEDQTLRLQNELHLFTAGHEQVNDQFYDYGAQQQNDPGEIDDVLKEMEQFDEDEDDDEFSKFV